MNILVTGANGQLGKSLQELNIEIDGLTWFYTNHDQLDITNSLKVNDFITNNEIDIIINCAAYTNVDKAEEYPEICNDTNCKGVKYLVESISKRNGLFIQISSDYVFGKEIYNTPCTEEMKGKPSGVYGESKLHGEDIIMTYTSKYIIIRTSWLYSEFGNNFVKTMIKLINYNDTLNVVFDQIGTPTYAYDLALVIYKIVQRYIYGCELNYGIYNYSNEGACSWYDFSKHIQEILNNKTCKILPCHSNEYPSKVIRPNYSVLDKTKIKNEFDIEIPYWTNSLQKCIKNILK